MSILNFTSSKEIAEAWSPSSGEEFKFDNSKDDYVEPKKSNESFHVPPALSKISLSKNNGALKINKTNDLKDVWYLLAYILLNSR